MKKFYFKYKLVFQFFLIQLLLFFCIYFELEGNEFILLIFRFFYMSLLLNFIDNLIERDVYL